MAETIVTEPNKKSPDELTPRQLNAIELLAQGRKINVIAAELEISRHQIWKWQQNPYFVAAIHRARNELWNDAKTRLRGLVDKSVDILEQAVESGDVKASIEVLKITGLYGKIGCPKGPLTAEEVMIEESKAFVKNLLIEPDTDVFAKAAFIQRMEPTLIAEKYMELKEELEQTTGEDESEKRAD